ncbi:unnamed protein product [Polarella glacialis]|uniref:Uncharacterized protein n=1 Tax=Polarella glacialis TaxID=89957 RepID=A0A813GN79_POLGL|nr:unnamed protein product [Polarella glacialis]
MHDDGTMYRRDDSLEFAARHNFTIVTVQQIIDYRRKYGLSAPPSHLVTKQAAVASSSSLTSVPVASLPVETPGQTAARLVALTAHNAESGRDDYAARSATAACRKDGTAVSGLLKVQVSSDETGQLDLTALCCSAALPGRAIGSRWQGVFRQRGFPAALVQAAKLSASDLVTLERWGGQFWDAWCRPSLVPGEELVFLRHRAFGTAVLLTGGSNGWFEFIVARGRRPQVFYSGGSTEELNALSVALPASEDHGTCLPMLKLPNEMMSCWRWQVEKWHGLDALHGPPGVLRAQRRLRLTASGFSAYPDTWRLREGPCLVVERGVVVRGKS